MSAIVGQPYKYATGNFETAAIGQYFVARENLTSQLYRVPTFAQSGTCSYKVMIYAADGAGNDPGTLLYTSDTITIDTTDKWWDVPFSTLVSLTSGTDYWIIPWASASYAVYTTTSDDGLGRKYKDSTLTWPTVASPANASNGTTIERLDEVQSGYLVCKQLVPLPSFYGAVAIPMDDPAATNSATQNTWSQQFHGLETGDHLFAIMVQRGTATHSIGVTGGQTFADFAAFNAAANLSSTRVFYTTFNGIWTASPRFDFSAGTNTTVVLVAFRPGGGTTSTWAIDVTQAAGTFVAGTTPFTKTITGITTLNARNISLAIWTAPDDNRYDNIAGTGWIDTNFKQFRNVAGTDSSVSVAYKIQAAAGATGNVSKNQSTLGGDAGATSIFSFYEKINNRNGLNIQQAVKRSNSF